MRKDIKIFYFTGTGNSLRIATAIEEKVLGRGGHVEVFDIAKTNPGQIGSLEDILLVIYPVYAWGIPHIVASFIENLPQGNNNEVWIVATNGGDHGNGLYMAKNRLEQRGYKVMGGMGIRMPNNYVVSGSIENKQEAQRIIGEGIKRAEECVENIILGEPTDIGIPNIFKNLFYKIAYGGFNLSRRWMGTKFRIDDKCTKCGYCAKICPVDNIKMGERGPLWEGKCEQCFRCINYCPARSIQTFGLTKKADRYNILPIKYTPPKNPQ